MQVYLFAITIILIPLLVFSNQKLNIVATTYPIYYPLIYLTEGLHNVDLLISTPADPHHYEIKPNDLLKLKKADYVFLLGLENWERQIERNVNKKKLVPLYKDLNLIKFRGIPDPHVWTSPKSYKALVVNIYKGLVLIDKQNEYEYKARLDKYLKILDELDKDYQNVLQKCKVRVIASTHLSTSYLARDYNLQAAGIKGIHAEEEPSPTQMKNLINTLKAKKVNTIFVEPGQDKSVAEKIAKAVNAQILTLNTSLFPERKDDDYVSIMKRNLETLKKGLQCQ